MAQYKTKKRDRYSSEKIIFRRSTPSSHRVASNNNIIMTNRKGKRPNKEDEQKIKITKDVFNLMFST